MENWGNGLENDHTEVKNMGEQGKKRKHLTDVDENVYYGVHIPNTLDCQLFDDIEKTNVFTDKIEALKLVKKYKKARFKVFSYYHEAVEFATHGCEFSNNVSLISTNPKKDAEKDAVPTGVASEKCQFRGPKSQDLVKLRKAIETNDLNYVERTVWENPRYLISSGDTPSILQEGFRYNGLHVAAKAKHAEMCELILNTIGNTSFIEKLYGEESYQNSEDRSKILLDLYLNTPDKGLNETPLHFAVKFGAVKVTEVLVSFPQCDKNVRNKYGKLPSQIICDRCDGSTTEKLKEQIAALLEENFYVPVLRSEDNCTPPVIGEPFSPSSPPNFDNDPLKPRLEIHAYAGPMDKKGAEKFRKIWKTPPRSVSKSAFNRKCDRLSNSLDSITSSNLKLDDPEKGLEAVGRELATKYNVTWKEYWPFLDNFTDISSEEGLKQLENYLKDRNEKSFLDLSSPKKVDSSNVNDTNLDCSDSIDNLCKKFVKFCSLDDETEDEDSLTIMTGDLNDEEGICPFACVEHSLKIFSNRICNVLKNLLGNEDNNETGSNHLLMAEVKLFEQVIVSYIDDRRFLDIDFQCAHDRLARTIAFQLKNQESKVIFSNVTELKLKEFCVRNLDSLNLSDDSFNTERQLGCLLKYILKFIDEKLDGNSEDYQKVWKNAERCSCLFSNKQLKHKYGSRRKHGNNNNLSRKTNGVKSRGSVRDSNLNGISKNLFQTESTDNNKDEVFNFNEVDVSSSSEDDEEFYTPPSSPLPLEKDYFICDDDNDSFDDSRLPEVDVFIEGSEPTKIDRDVYNALKYASDKLNPDDFPNIYKWRHAISLYSDEERKSWSSPKPDYNISVQDSPAKITSTPCRGNPPNRDLSFNSPPVHASPKSWFRITGLNSPRASLNTYRNSLSFNM